MEDMNFRLFSDHVIYNRSKYTFITLSDILYDENISIKLGTFNMTIPIHPNVSIRIRL